MLEKGMRKPEIEAELEKRGEFVQIDYLTRFLKKDTPIDIKKFCYEKLAQIYEKKSMFSEAAKSYEGLAILAIPFTEKMSWYVKEAEAFIKAGFFDRADDAVRKAVSQANAVQRNEINIAMKDFYRRQAETYEKNLKRSQAVRVYEKMLEMNISESERQEIKGKLMKLYEKLGRIQDMRPDTVKIEPKRYPERRGFSLGI